MCAIRCYLHRTLLPFLMSEHTRCCSLLRECLKWTVIIYEFVQSSARLVAICIDSTEVVIAGTSYDSYGPTQSQFFVGSDAAILYAGML